MVRTEVSNIDGISNFSQEVPYWRSWSLSQDDENEVQNILVNLMAILVILSFAI